MGQCRLKLSNALHAAMLQSVRSQDMCLFWYFGIFGMFWSPRGDVTRSPKQGFTQWPHKKDYKNLLKNVLVFKPRHHVQWSQMNISAFL